MFQNIINENFPYSLFTVIVLIIFYAVYVGKMLVQKRQGICTNQMGKRKERKLHTVETLMKTATYSIVLIQLFSVIFGRSCLPSAARLIGFLIGLAGDGIFLIAVLCMKDSWRAGIPEKDKTDIITDGIYAFSRNPAFLGFDLMYLGVLLMYFNLLTALFTAFAAVMLHLQILQEEKYLTATFGNDYLNYKDKVLRYFGRKFNTK